VTKINIEHVYFGYNLNSSSNQLIFLCVSLLKGNELW